MSGFNRTFKIGLATFIMGMLLSLASAWCEVEAHLNHQQPIQAIGQTSNAGTIYRETPSYYLTSSMAIRLFSVGALFIVVGALQVQRDTTSERLARVEQELAAFRNRTSAT